MAKKIKSAKKNSKTNAITKQKYMSNVHPGFLKLITRGSRVNDSYLSGLAQDLAKWALNNEKALKITQFLNVRGIPSQTFTDWMKRNEELSAANKYALQVIGTRREILALNKELDTSMVKFTMATYDKDWRKLEEWRADLRNSEVQATNNIVVIEPLIEEMKKEEGCSEKEGKRRLSPEEIARRITEKTKS